MEPYINTKQISRRNSYTLCSFSTLSHFWSCICKPFRNKDKCIHINSTMQCLHATSETDVGTFALSPCFLKHQISQTLIVFILRDSVRDKSFSYTREQLTCFITPLQPSIPCTAFTLHIAQSNSVHLLMHVTLSSHSESSARSTAYLGSPWQLRVSTCSTEAEPGNTVTLAVKITVGARRSFDESVTEGSHTQCQWLYISHTSLWIYMTTPQNKTDLVEIHCRIIYAC